MLQRKAGATHGRQLQVLGLFPAETKRITVLTHGGKAQGQRRGRVPAILQRRPLLAHRDHHGLLRRVPAVTQRGWLLRNGRPHDLVRGVLAVLQRVPLIRHGGKHHVFRRAGAVLQRPPVLPDRRPLQFSRTARAVLEGKAILLDGLQLDVVGRPVDESERVAVSTHSQALEALGRGGAPRDRPRA